VQKTDLYFLMINTSFNTVDFRITKNLYDTMVRFQIPIDNRIKMAYFLHFKKDLAEQKEMNSKGGRKVNQAQEQISDKEYLINRKEQQILITNSKLCKRVGY
jgi:hypothetical protein